MPPSDLAQEHQTSLRELAQSLDAEGVRLWQQAGASELSPSWQLLLARLAPALAAAQLSAAGRADGYVDAVAADLGVDTEAAGRVVPESLAGRASDGRSLRSLLLSPLVVARTALARGVPLQRSLTAGQANLRMILRTQVLDAGRAADGVAIAARPTMGYVRQVTPPSCPRCAVLAGKFYRYSQGFQRHPYCDCIHVPAPESQSGDLRTDPKRLFDEGQVQGLSKADARAIREGADINRVVNAHRGMYTADGGRKLTAELAGGRGGISRIRLRPEQIYREAASREDTIRLLRLHGYLTQGV